jgi:diguanylate cyclase (GGDEF)-like protein
LKILFCLLALLWACATSANPLDDLLEANELRISNHTKAEKILAAMDVATLTPYQKNYHTYLSTILATYTQDFDTVIDMYDELLPKVKNNNLRIRVMQSLLNTLTAKGYWDKALSLSAKLLGEISSNPTSTDTYEGYLGLSAFYLTLEKPEMVMRFTERILTSDIASDTARCGAMANKLGALNLTGENQFSSALFDDAIRFCSDKGLAFYVDVINYYRGQSLILEKRYNEAIVVIKNSVPDNKSYSFDPLSTAFYALLSTAYVNIGDYENARKNADLVIAIDKQENYPDSFIKAYKALAQVYEIEGDYQSAHHYLKLHIEKAQSEYEIQLAKQLAIQQAWFELEAKNSEINLLDKQNVLLKTQAQLITERLESSLLALALAVFILFVVLFWFYRSRNIQKKLRYLAQTDVLTEVYNRGYFTERFLAELESGQRKQQTISLLLLDLDHFKGINDNYGHQVGDWALRSVVRVIEQCLPERAFIGRMGGEEFGVLVPQCTAETGFKIAEVCRQAIASIDTQASGHRFSVTASFGVSDTKQVGYSLDNLVSASDLALYQSKRYGRNRVYEYDANFSS